MITNFRIVAADTNETQIFDMLNTWTYLRDQPSEFQIFTDNPELWTRPAKRRVQNHLISAHSAHQDSKVNIYPMDRLKEFQEKELQATERTARVAKSEPQLKRPHWAEE